MLEVQLSSGDTSLVAAVDKGEVLINDVNDDAQFASIRAVVDADNAADLNEGVSFDHGELGMRELKRISGGAGAKF